MQTIRPQDHRNFRSRRNTFYIPLLGNAEDPVDPLYVGAIVTAKSMAYIYIAGKMVGGLI